MKKEDIISMLKTLELYANLNIELCKAKINNKNSDYIRDLELQISAVSEGLEVIGNNINEASFPNFGHIPYSISKKIH